MGLTPLILTNMWFFLTFKLYQGLHILSNFFDFWHESVVLVGEQNLFFNFLIVGLISQILVSIAQKNQKIKKHVKALI